MTDDELQRAHSALQRQRRADRSAVNPPPPGQLRALVEGSMPQSEREALLDRTFASGASDDLALLHAFASPSGTTSTRAVPPSRRLVRWAAAAALVLMVGAPVVLQLREGSETEARYRGAPEQANVPILANASAVSGAMVFSWSRVNDAAYYTMEVLDGNASSIVRRETSDTTITLPDSVLVATGVRSGMNWWVTAHLNSGSERRSALRSIEEPLPQVPE